MLIIDKQWGNYSIMLSKTQYTIVNKKYHL